MTDAVIVLNAGPTSPKFGAYCANARKTLPLLCRGQIDSMRGDPHFVFNDENGKPFGRSRVGPGPGDRSQDSLAVRDYMFGIQDASIKVVAVHADAGEVVTVIDAILRSTAPRRGRRKT